MKNRNPMLSIGDVLGYQQDEMLTVIDIRISIFSSSEEEYYFDDDSSELVEIIDSDIINGRYKIIFQISQPAGTQIRSFNIEED